jgi:hypothetical protein
MCYSPPGKDRPKDFEAKEGTARTLSVWEREKKVTATPPPPDCASATTIR